ncbi:MAG: polyamine aminopropyltransferase [Aeromonadaceae bacterium]
MNDELHEWLSPELALRWPLARRLTRITSPYQKIEVWQTGDFGRLFTLDDKLMTSEGEEWLYHEPLNQIPAMTHPHPKRALIIGGGDGGSARQLLKHASLQEIVICELDAEVLAMARHYLPKVHQGALDAPRVQIVIGDGMAYLQQAPGPFDLIILDLTDPHGLAAPLYEMESLHHCQRLLGEQGLLSLHLGSPLLQPEQCAQLIARLRSVFACVRPVLTPVLLYGGLWSLACASQLWDPKALDSPAIAQRLAERQIQGLHYYNAETHVACLAQPNFMHPLLG